MRISDWSSDVCSSDLKAARDVAPGERHRAPFDRSQTALGRHRRDAARDRIRIRYPEDERARREPEAETDRGEMGPALTGLVALRHSHRIAMAAAGRENGRAHV